MIRAAPLLLLVPPMPLAAQSISAGNWEVKSTATELVIPGVSGLLLKMMKGRSKTERKCLLPDQAQAGGAALFAPDPKAKCTVERSRIAGGRIDQVMMCPQKKGQPLRLERTGSYGAAAFTSRMIMTGDAPKGPMRMVIDQAGSRTAATCR